MRSYTHRTGPPREAHFTAWRHRTLVAAGFDEPLARRLAAEPLMDLHALLELVDRACPPELAARICAPLDAREGR